MAKCIFTGCLGDATEDLACTYCYETKIIPAKARLKNKSTSYVPHGHLDEFKHNYGEHELPYFDTITKMKQNHAMYRM